MYNDINNDMEKLKGDLQKEIYNKENLNENNEALKNVIRNQLSQLEHIKKE